MPTIMRYRYNWTGWSGAPGYTSFYADMGGSADQMVVDSHNFMHNAFTNTGGVVTMLPQDVKINGDAFVDHLEDSTGAQIDQVGVTPPAQVLGIGGGAYSAPSGACVTWNTANFIKGRRLRGRTFLVPLSAAAYDDKGSLDDSYMTGLLSVAQTMINAPTGFLVWHRPTTKGGTDGSSSMILTVTVKDKASVLRSRRD